MNINSMKTLQEENRAQPKRSMAQTATWVVSWELTHHEGYSNV